VRDSGAVNIWRVSEVYTFEYSPYSPQQCYANRQTKALGESEVKLCKCINGKAQVN
jgi:hypothetical protein